MTNFSRWQTYCRDFSSPQQYVDFGFYYMIAAALQRRVWIGPSHAKLYPNQYVVLCGDPGIGKGLILKQVASFLSFHKKFSRGGNETPVEEGPAYINSKSAKQLQDDPLCIPLGSDTATWQGLIQELIESYDVMPIPAYMDAGVKRTSYMHSSLAYVLEELSSILKKNTEDVANMFLKTYDCEDYTYRTVGRKLERVSKTCMNFLAGTTPSFMQETFDDKLLNEGFSSRTFYICAEKNRHDKMFIEPLDNDQQIARMELLMHLKELTKLYGQCTYSKEAYEYLEWFWPAFKQGKIPKANSSTKLLAYYSRFNIHIQKMAMADHFGEVADNNNKVIGLGSVKRAIERLETAAKHMHLALVFKAQNPLSNAGKKLISFLKGKGRATSMECKIELFETLKVEETEDLITTYVAMGKIVAEQDKETSIQYFRVKEEK